MCTAISHLAETHYFGRNLDLEYSYEEAVTITPRNFPFSFRGGEELKNHYAMIGMAYVVDGYPLYYDGTNEKGLSVAALSFPGEARYHTRTEGAYPVAPFEMIPYLLGKCADTDEAEQLLSSVVVWDHAFNDDLPNTPLHWLVADRNRAVTVESTENGLQIYENPVGVLTNAPSFDFQLKHLSLYTGLSAEPIGAKFLRDQGVISNGMGALGLPGDLSSTSRFVRAAFMKHHSVSHDTEASRVHQFFHILGSVEQVRGAVHLGEGKYEITVYTSCCNTDTGVYYYSTYENRSIVGVDMRKEALDGQTLAVYPLCREGGISVMDQKSR